MDSVFFKYSKVAPCPSIRNIVSHYRIGEARLSSPIIFPNYSPIFQGLIFNIHPLEDNLFVKEHHQRLDHKVYYIGQALSPSTIMSSSLNMSTIAVHFKPNGIYQLIDASPKYLIDTITDAELLFGKSINELQELIIISKKHSERIKLINDYLKRLSKNKIKESHNSVVKTIDILHSHNMDIRIDKLQQLTFSNIKTLERNFKNETGLTPKMFQNLIRFNRTKRFIERVGKFDALQTAIHFGYYDQSHMIKEFKKFSGRTPFQYVDNLIHGH